MLFIRLKRYSFPIAIFVISRVVIAVGLFFAARIFVSATPVGDVIQQLWLRWDAGWYVSVARDGYKYIPYQQSSVAFFPVLPMLIRLFMTVTDPITAGLIIVNVCVLFAYVLFYALVRLEFPDDERIAQRALLYIAFFPTAIFSCLIFTEGVFLMLAVATFYFARRRLWSLSVALAILASATRVTGVLLAAVVALEWARAHGLMLSTIFRRDAWRGFWSGLRASPLTAAAIVLIPLGLVSYMVYLQIAFGNPLLFIQVQNDWGRLLASPFLQTFHEVSGFFNALVAGKPIVIESMFNDTSFVISLILSVIVWWRLGTIYGLFALASVLIPASTSLISFSRYAGIFFPIFILLALWGKRSAVHQAIFSLFCLLLGIVLVLYVGGTFLA